MKRVLMISIALFVVVATVYIYSDKKVVKKEFNLSFANTKKTFKDSWFPDRTREKAPVKILFVGDMMFDRSVRRKINEKGLNSVFAGVGELFKGPDLIVGNLEGAVTSNKSLSLYNNEILRFTFDVEILSLLKSNNFGLLSLANNHSMDFGKSGYDDTQKNIKKNGIRDFGSYYNDQDIFEAVVLEGKNFCFIGYHDLSTYDETPVLNKIKETNKKCHETIIFAHWGNEYLESYTERQKELAHKFIDEGADLVIGAHPHVVEPVEIYKNKAIFYSLGNFVFDQYFSFETEHGIALSVFFYMDKTYFEIIPVEIKNGEVNFVDAGTASQVLEPIKTKSLFETNKENNSYGFYTYK